MYIMLQRCHACSSTTKHKPYTVWESYCQKLWLVIALANRFVVAINTNIITPSLASPHLATTFKDLNDSKCPSTRPRHFYLEKDAINHTKTHNFFSLANLTSWLASKIPNWFGGIQFLDLNCPFAPCMPCCNDAPLQQTRAKLLHHANLMLTKTLIGSHSLSIRFVVAARTGTNIPPHMFHPTLQKHSSNLNAWHPPILPEVKLWWIWSQPY